MDEANKSVEIYLRKSGDSHLLHLNIPIHMKSEFIRALEGNGFNANGLQIFFEMHARPEYLTDGSEDHIRVKLDRVSLIESE